MLSNEQIENFNHVLAKINAQNFASSKTSVIHWRYLKEDLNKNGYEVTFDEDTCMALEVAANTNTLYGNQSFTVPMIVEIEDSIISINLTMFMNSSYSCYLGVDLETLNLNLTQNYHA